MSCGFFLRRILWGFNFLLYFSRKNIKSWWGWLIVRFCWVFDLSFCFLCFVEVCWWWWWERWLSIWECWLGVVYFSLMIFCMVFVGCVGIWLDIVVNELCLVWLWLEVWLWCYCSFGLVVLLMSCLFGRICIKLWKGYFWF